MSIQQKLKHELRAIILVTLFFAAWLGFLMGLKFLILEDYHIRIGGFSVALIGALVLAKVVLILEHERDVIRLRTNYRSGEESYLYRTKITPDRARERFLEYISTVNGLRDRPRWYNAITTNCTTAIRAQHPASERLPWDWRMLANGKGDAMLFERNMFSTGGLPFRELRKGVLINPAAKAAEKSPDFSNLIREGRPGF